MPTIIIRNKNVVRGMAGDGEKTAELWERFYERG
jgi:hypothetical protein